MEINYRDLKDGDIVWACAYTVDYDRLTYRSDKVKHLYAKPYSCCITSYYGSLYCCPIGKTGKVCKSLSVRIKSRCYAATYEECVEIYNGLIDDKISTLTEAIKECKSEKV